jgi:hypothetical protein
MEQQIVYTIYETFLNKNIFRLQNHVPYGDESSISCWTSSSCSTGWESETESDWEGDDNHHLKNVREIISIDPNCENDIFFSFIAKTVECI